MSLQIRWLIPILNKVTSLEMKNIITIALCLKNPLPLNTTLIVHVILIENNLKTVTTNHVIVCKFESIQ